MSSASSKILSTRVEKGKIHKYHNELNGAGIYLLLIGNDSIYVGETGLDTLENRIMNTHTGTIDSQWHTVLAFKFSAPGPNHNELKFIENAMCEYVYNHYPCCMTITPSKANCNAKYRNAHYNLLTSEIDICDSFVKDIKHYIGLFPGSIFPKPKSVPPNPATGNVQLFSYQSAKGDVAGQAEIDLQMGKTTIKKNARISVGVSPHFTQASAIMKQRQDLVKKGKIVGQVLQEDLDFNSPSGAGAFLTGTSVSGNKIWKRVTDKKTLGDVLGKK